MSVNLKDRGYIDHKVIENKKAYYELRDGTILEINVIIKSVLFVNNNTVGTIDANMYYVFYTTKDLRNKLKIEPLADIEYNSIQEGKFIFEVNGFEFTIVPVIIQIKRVGQKDNLGNISYQISANAKSLVKKL